MQRKDTYPVTGVITIPIPKGVCTPSAFFENLGLKVTPQFVLSPTAIGVLTSVGNPRSFHQFERRSNSHIAFDRVGRHKRSYLT